MSQQEMDQMDREVMALVNDRQTEQEEIPCGPGPEEDTAPIAEEDPHADSHKVADWRRPLQEKDGMYCISKDDFDMLDAAARKTRRIRNTVRIAVCLAIIAVLCLAYCRPELLSYLTAAGVVACSVMIGVCLERLVEGNQ